MPGFKFGEYEYHIIKSGHLGLCVAAGALLSAAKSTFTCPCGSKQGDLLLAMGFLFLLSVPIGFVIIIGLRVRATFKRNKVFFQKIDKGGSWKAHMGKVMKAPVDYGQVVHPGVSVAIIKVSLGCVGALGIILGMSAAIAGDYATAGIYFAVGIVLNVLCSLFFKKRSGRALACKLTNLFGGCVGIKYSINKKTNVITTEKVDKKYLFMLPIVGLYAWIGAKFAAFVKKEDLEILSQRGEWVTSKDGEDNTDVFAMFYEEFTNSGSWFIVFLMIKNLCVGLLLLTDEPKLIDKISRVWIVAVLYVIELFSYLFLPITCDAIEGLKIAFLQVQQTMVIVVAALTASEYISEPSGEDFIIMFSIIQVSLALPEQIFGILLMTSLKREAPPGEPEFPCTPMELRHRREIGSIGMMDKIRMAKASVMDIKAVM